MPKISPSDNGLIRRWLNGSGFAWRYDRHPFTLVGELAESWRRERKNQKYHHYVNLNKSSQRRSERYSNSFGDVSISTSKQGYHYIANGISVSRAGREFLISTAVLRNAASL